MNGSCQTRFSAAYSFSHSVNHSFLPFQVAPHSIKTPDFLLVAPYRLWSCRKFISFTQFGTYHQPLVYIMATDVPNVPPSEGSAPALRQTRSQSKLKEELMGGAKKPKSSKLNPTQAASTQRVTFGPQPPDTPEATPEPEAARLQTGQQRQQTQAAGSSGPQAVASNVMPAASETPHKGAAETAGTSAGPSSSQSQVTYPDLSAQTVASSVTPAATDTTRTEEFVDSDGNALTAEALEESEEEEDEAEAEDERQALLEDGMDLDKMGDPPDAARKELYKKATPAISNLATNPDDPKALFYLNGTNDVIKQLNVKEEYGLSRSDDHIIRIGILQYHFKDIKACYAMLDKEYEKPEERIKAHDKAWASLNNNRRLLGDVVRRYSFPEAWIPAIRERSNNAPQPSGVPAIAINDDKREPHPQHGSDSSTASHDDQHNPAPQPGGVTVTANLPDDMFKGGVKSQVHVRVPDMSNGRTPFGKVIHVRTAGSYGYRVIVNRGTLSHPYLEIYPGATFGKGMAKMWFESGSYQMPDLPKDSNLPEVAFEARVRVKRVEPRQLTPRQTRAMKAMPPDSKQMEWEYWLHEAVTFYIIKNRATGEVFIASSVALRNTKGFSLAMLEQKDLEVEKAMDVNHAEILYFLENNRHPDTGNKLTDEDYESMPWFTRRQA